MTLFDLYEPLFQYICMLNRIARQGDMESIDYGALRATMTGMLKNIRRQAQSDPVLAMQAAKLEMPTIFFVDSMIAESKLKCAAQWHRNRIAFEKNELAGDEKFFDYLDETLKNPSAQATERLVIYFGCLGLGFMGWYASQPEKLREYMQNISRRIGMLADHASRICPEAYECLDTRNLIQPPGTRIGAILLAFLALSILVVAVNFYLFRIGSLGLEQSLREIQRHALIWF